MEEFKQDLTAEELIQKYSSMIYRLAYSRTQNIHDAEDITQEVFLKYIKAGKKFNEEEHRKAWLLTVTANTGKSFVTSAWMKHRTSMEEAEQIPAATKESNSEVSDAVKKLPEKYRIVIHLYYYEECSILQISQIIKERESTVKSQLHRARIMLKSLLKEDEYEF